MTAEIISQLSSGQIARLIPTVSESKKEERATSSLLATFMVVPSFTESVLSDAGASVGKRSKITCYTEIVFKTPDKEAGKLPRPDGLIVITNGKRSWSALVESKIGTKELTNLQVEEYLALAKKYKIDAVITISNQFATTPAHHPLSVPKSKTKSVELYHFSWLSLKSKALLLTGDKDLNDPEQAYILSELIRYLDHDSSGVTSFTRMPTKWKDLCASVQNGIVLQKNADTVSDAVSGWHQLLRHLSLNLSIATGQPVSISLSRQRLKDADLNFSEDCVSLVKDSCLEAEFAVPNAASRISLTADVLRKVVSISMKLEAPKDKSRATASINWLTRQLNSVTESDIALRAYWPKRIADTMEPLHTVLEDPSALIPDNVKELPTHFEVIRIVDLGGKFKGAKTFVESVSLEFPRFYHDAGQLLTKWVAQAPKIKEVKKDESSIPTIFSDFRDVLPIVEDKSLEQAYESKS